nr:ABC transporter substrate-binding protein [Tumebacillus amylolyticus]
MGSFGAALLLTLVVSGCGTKDTATSATAEQADEKPVFHYAMSGLYKPFNFKENGNLQGFDVEIGQALADKMGMKPEPVTNPWETLIQGLQAKKYDAILGSMTITKEREKAVDFTDPYYRSGAQIFVRSDSNDVQTPTDLQGKRIGVVKASTYKTLAEQYSDHVSTYDSDLTALMDLPTKRLDVVITDQMVGFRGIKEGVLKIKPVGEPLTHDDQGIAVRKGDQELRDKLNKALQEIEKDGTYEKISQKWFGRNILGQSDTQH